MPRSSLACIYSICHINSGRRYIGSAVHVKKRWSMHRHLLSIGKHHSIKLQRAWAKYGADAFVFEILEIVPLIEHLVEREQYWIDCYGAAGPKTGFNVAPIAGTSLGRKHPPDVRAKMRAKSRKGKKLPPRSPEHCIAISAAKIGKSVPALQKPKSSAHKKTQSMIMVGRKMPWIAESNRARKGEKRPASSIAMMGNRNAIGNRRVL